VRRGNSPEDEPAFAVYVIDLCVCSSLLMALVLRRDQADQRTLLCFTLALGKIEEILFGCSGTSTQWELAQLKSGNQHSFRQTPAPTPATPNHASFLPRPGMGLAHESSVPRKEVIQPHLPVRLPCYDFTPITDPTLDACLPLGLAQRLQVLPTFVV